MSDSTFWVMSPGGILVPPGGDLGGIDLAHATVVNLSHVTNGSLANSGIASVAASKLTGTYGTVQAQRLSGTNPTGTTTVAPGTNAGTTATATVAAGFPALTDMFGVIDVLVQGTSIAAGLMATVTFANAYSAVPGVLVSYHGVNISGQCSATNESTTSFQIRMSTLPTTGSHYFFAYFVWGS